MNLMFCSCPIPLSVLFSRCKRGLVLSTACISQKFVASFAYAKKCLSINLTWFDSFSP
uniref:Uncharacterized protein n=1 Tax=Rhizophora mucronata TaxID=61149 RepID=A0A2P2QEC3_RHIMU